MDNMPNVTIEEECDGFNIHVNGKRWRFDQEDSIEELVSVFEELGINCYYEEVY